MKKILSLGVAAAMMALSAVAVSAETTVAQTALEDTKVTFEVTVTSETATTADLVVKVGAGLTDVTFTEGDIGLSSYGKDTGKLAVVNTKPINGVVLTISGTVTDADTATVTVTGSEIADDGTSVAVDVAKTADLSDVPEESSTSPEESSTSPEDSSTSPEDSSTSPEDSSTTPDESGNTGVALAVVPAVIAGAALIVSKKRK